LVLNRKVFTVITIDARNVFHEDYILYITLSSSSSSSSEDEEPSPAAEAATFFSSSSSSSPSLSMPLRSYTDTQYHDKFLLTDNATTPVL